MFSGIHFLLFVSSIECFVSMIKLFKSSVSIWLFLVTALSCFILPSPSHLCLWYLFYIINLFVPIVLLYPVSVVEFIFLLQWCFSDGWWIWALSSFSPGSIRNLAWIVMGEETKTQASVWAASVGLRRELDHERHTQPGLALPLSASRRGHRDPAWVSSWLVLWIWDLRLWHQVLPEFPTCQPTAALQILGLASPHNCLSQFLKINQSISLYFSISLYKI